MCIKQKEKPPRERREKVARGRAQNAKQFGAMPLETNKKARRDTGVAKHLRLSACCRVPCGTPSWFYYWIQGHRTKMLRILCSAPGYLLSPLSRRFFISLGCCAWTKDLCALCLFVV